MRSVRHSRRGVAGFSYSAFCALGLALGLESRAQAQQPLFEFVQISDPQPQNSGDEQGFVDVLRTIAEAGRPGALLPRRVDLVLIAGDITDGNSTSEWTAAKSKLDTWLTANGIPFRAVPGNHDVDGSNTALYNQYIGSSDVWDIGSASFTGHNGLTRTTGWQGLRFIGFNNSNPDYNQISSADVTRITTRVNAAAAANENVFLLCHHPHDGSGRMPLASVLPNPSIVGYLHGHSGSPRVKKGLSGITNPSVWDVDTNAIIYDRDLVYFDVYPNELRAHVVILNDNPTSLPAGVVIPLAHPLTSIDAESLYGVAGPVHANARAAPSGASPERKLWQNAGSLWGILWSDSASAYRIQRFNPSLNAYREVLGREVARVSKDRQGCHHQQRPAAQDHAEIDEERRRADENDLHRRRLDDIEHARKAGHSTQAIPKRRDIAMTGAVGPDSGQNQAGPDCDRRNAAVVSHPKVSFIGL